MSSDVAICVDNLAKRYTIGARQDRYKTLRESVMDVVGAPLRRLRRREQREEEILWALRDVSFDIKKGEVVGVIGRNGAGKSTLLKVLSRITEPTSGRAEIHGRVGSLLEVGTGFHPELSGRENIYLNGAILGMKRVEIDRKLDEIVAFAEVERFLDTAVKHYSSGMYLRLAFAVAAHLDTEVLLVDEVLAVGDAAFQRKCLNKIGMAGAAGRTSIFVSHNLHAIQQTCSQALWFDKGQLKECGPTTPLVQRYLAEAQPDARSYFWPKGMEPGDSDFRLLGISVRPAVGDSFTSDTPVVVEIHFSLARLPQNLCIGFDLLTPDGILILRSFHTDSPPGEWPNLRLGDGSITCSLPANLLNRGTYALSALIGLHAEKWVARTEQVIQFEVSLQHGTSPLWCPQTRSTRPGLVALILPWESPRRASEV
jgi:lipopolysaccharide transport system ATP-binding protein